MKAATTPTCHRGFCTFAKSDCFFVYYNIVYILLFYYPTLYIFVVLYLYIFYYIYINYVYISHCVIEEVLVYLYCDISYESNYFFSLLLATALLKRCIYIFYFMNIYCIFNLIYCLYYFIWSPWRYKYIYIYLLKNKIYMTYFFYFWKLFKNVYI